jgi:hypothetical protein
MGATAAFMQRFAASSNGRETRALVGCFRLTPPLGGGILTAGNDDQKPTHGEVEHEIETLKRILEEVKEATRITEKLIENAERLPAPEG